MKISLYKCRVFYTSLSAMRYANVPEVKINGMPKLPVKM